MASASSRSPAQRSKPSPVAAASNSRAAAVANFSMLSPRRACGDSQSVWRTTLIPSGLRAATAMAENPESSPLGRNVGPAAPPSATA